MEAGASAGIFRLCNRLKPTSIALLLLVIAGCASIPGSQWDRLYGAPKALEIPVIPHASKLSYYQHTRPILEQRCVVCHGCYDAPCQLKLDSYEGLLRGANIEKV